MLSCSKGAIYAITGSSFTITSSRFVNNTSSSGGALTLMGCGAKAKVSSIAKSVFNGNEAVTGNGGAVRSQSCPALVISDTTFSTNVAKLVRSVIASWAASSKHIVCNVHTHANAAWCYLDVGWCCSVHGKLRVNSRHARTLHVHREQRSYRQRRRRLQLRTANHQMNLTSGNSTSFEHEFAAMASASWSSCQWQAAYEHCLNSCPWSMLAEPHIASLCMLTNTS